MTDDLSIFFCFLCFLVIWCVSGSLMDETIGTGSGDSSESINNGMGSLISKGTDISVTIGLSILAIILLANESLLNENESIRVSFKNSEKNVTSLY